ncbi:unnamed protein product [marine sediment metagenome]|uniref:Uncharacterized protein n=1 Tax=marine sediment metagenome TaxID=412755 RepID=X1JHR2_9ZZZZ
MSLKSVYGLRAIRSVVRQFIIEKGFRPRRVRRGFRIPRAKYLFSYYNEEGILVAVFYDKKFDTVLECDDVKKKHNGVLQFTQWDHDVLLSLLEGTDSN